MFFYMIFCQSVKKEMMRVFQHFGPEKEICTTCMDFPHPETFCTFDYSIVKQILKT